MIAKVQTADLEQVKIEIAKLIGMFNTQDNVKIVSQLKSIVPEYKSNNSIYESLDNH